LRQQWLSSAYVSNCQGELSNPSMRRLLTPGRRLAFPIPIFSGKFVCHIADREFWREQYWLSQEHWENIGATSMIAGYTPGRTATISTTVYQLWRTNDDGLAFKWVMVNMLISFVVLLAVNMLEKKNIDRSRRSVSGKGGL